MKTDFQLGCERGFLPIEGTRVLVSGTRFNGCRGTVVKRPQGWPRRAIPVLLDEFDIPEKFFRHHLWTEIELMTRGSEP